MRSFHVGRTLLHRPLLSRRFQSSFGGSFLGGSGDFGASEILGRVVSHQAEDVAASSFASRLREATASKDDRLPTRLADTFSDPEVSNAPTSSEEILSSRSTLNAAMKMRSSERPFSKRLEMAITNAIGDVSHDLSGTLLAANLGTSEIKVATTTINLKTTLQTTFPVVLSHPISLSHVSHVCSALGHIHLTALRPEHSFLLVNERSQQLPAFSLLARDEADNSVKALSSPSQGRAVGLVVTVATAIVDEEFSMTTCKVHSEMDTAGLTLVWNTYVHKMTAAE